MKEALAYDISFDQQLEREGEDSAYGMLGSKSASEKDATVPDLAYEVATIRQRPQDEALYLLPDTGFLVHDQIRAFRENIENGVSLEDSMQQIEQDVQGFKTEYLVQQPVFPIVLEKAEYQGQIRLVGALYGGKPIVEAISETERDGTVRKSIEKIEQHLLTAEPGSLVVMTSPRGWSGYQNKNGKLEACSSNDVQNGTAKEIVYPDSQTYCFQVQENGDIRGFTLKSDIDIFQNEELLKKLGLPVENFIGGSDHNERIKNAVSNVAYLSPDAGIRIEDVVDLIEDIKERRVAYVDTDDNERTFDEMRDLLANPEQLWTLDNTTQALVDKLRRYIVWGLANNTVDVRDLEVALGSTVLRLMHKINAPTSQKEPASRLGQNVSESPTPFYNPEAILEEIQKIPGCAGGGIVDSVTPREAKIENGKDRIHCCTCPYCKKKVEAKISRGRIKCPNCKKTAKWTD